MLLLLPTSHRAQQTAKDQLANFNAEAERVGQSPSTRVVFSVYGIPASVPAYLQLQGSSTTADPPPAGAVAEHEEGNARFSEALGPSYVASCISLLADLISIYFLI